MARGVLTTWLVGMFSVFGATAMAAPATRVTSRSWQLDFRFHDPQRITVSLPGASEPTTFWYMLFEVTNDTGRDVEFFPSFQLVTDTLRVVEGGANISPAVYKAIADRHRKEFPFFASPMSITGPLLQGEENRRMSAVVFERFDPKASKFTVYVGGLSGEMARVTPPSQQKSAANPTADSPGYLVLRRTLAVSYDLPGDPQTRRQAKPIRRDRWWVMR